MSAFPGSQQAYETITGTPARKLSTGSVWQPSPVQLPTVDTSPAAFQRNQQYVEQNRSLQESRRQTELQMQNRRSELNQKIVEQMAMQDRANKPPPINAAQGMDAWRECRSQVGQVKRSAEAQRKEELQKALAMQAGPERMRAISQASRPRVIV